MLLELYSDSFSSLSSAGEARAVLPCRRCCQQDSCRDAPAPITAPGNSNGECHGSRGSPGEDCQCHGFPWVYPASTWCLCWCPHCTCSSNAAGEDVDLCNLGQWKRRCWDAHPAAPLYAGPCAVDSWQKQLWLVLALEAHLIPLQFCPTGNSPPR